MAIHTYRYRYTAEVEITVDDSKQSEDGRDPEEIAADALSVHGDTLLNQDWFDDEICHLGGTETGITGEVTKIPTWDPA